MRILFLCHRVPWPANDGARIRAFHLVRHLSARHSVTVASLATSAGEVARSGGLAAVCTDRLLEVVPKPLRTLRAIGRLPTRTPSSMGYFHSPRLVRRVAAELQRRQYDLVFVHSSSVAQYVPRGLAIPKLMDFCDMDSEKWIEYSRHTGLPRSWVYAWEGRKLRQAEKEIARRFEIGICTSPAELELLDSLAAGRRSACLRNGVDTEHFRPSEGRRDPDSICFVGRMSYFPNEQAMVELCSRILPLLRARRPTVRLTIVGQSPPRRVRRLGSHPGVQVTGWVRDVRPYLDSAAVMVAPLRIARGVQNKILESMAMGVPVVCSAAAAAGVDAVVGEHLRVARTPSEYAETILDLLDDEPARQRLGQAARSRMLSHHRWEHTLAGLEDLMAEARRISRA